MRCDIGFVSQRTLALTLGIALGVASLAVGGPASAAETASPTVASAWPVRLNLALPLGTTYSSDDLHGFTWGVRSTVTAYPTASGRGIGLGGYGEMLADARNRTSFTLGGHASMPVVQWDWGDLRVAGHAGYMTNDVRKGLSFGLGAALQVPFYLYEVQLGVRVSNTVSEGGHFGTSVLCDVDLGVLLAAYASKGR